MQLDYRPIIPRDASMELPALPARDLMSVSWRECRYQSRIIGVNTRHRKKNTPSRKDARGGPGTLSNRERDMRNLLHRRNTVQRSATYSIMAGDEKGGGAPSSSGSGSWVFKAEQSVRLRHVGSMRGATRPDSLTGLSDPPPDRERRTFLRVDFVPKPGCRALRCCSFCGPREER